VAHVQADSLASRDDDKLEGSKSVEVDEMYFGGHSKGGRGRPMVGDKHKIPVVGIVERSTEKHAGRVYAVTTPDVKKATVMEVIKERCCQRAQSSPTTSVSTTILAVTKTNTSTAASITARRCTSWATFTRTRLKDFGA